MLTLLQLKVDLEINFGGTASVNHKQNCPIDISGTNRAKFQRTRVLRHFLKPFLSIWLNAWPSRLAKSLPSHSLYRHFTSSLKQLGNLKVLISFTKSFLPSLPILNIFPPFLNIEWNICSN